MTNPHGNPNIVRYGMKTQFGQPDGPDPVILAREKNPSQVRAVLRRMACCVIDIANPPHTLADFALILAPDGRTLTGAEVLAVRKFQQAVTDWRAMDSLIDAIDGKQTQPIAEAALTLADLVNGSYELEK